MLLRRAERVAGNLPPLLVAAERVAATVAQGVHGRRRVGVGEAFWQFREYQPGDPVRRIDWRRSGRSDRIYIRETEWEAAQSVWIWTDLSASMRYRSGSDWPEKAERAAVLALALTVLLIRGGEHVGMFGGPERPGQGRATLERIAARLSDGLAVGGKSIGGKSGRPSLPLGHPLPRHGVLVMVGDFLTPLDEIASALRRQADNGVQGQLIQVVDPAERSLPFEGRIRFEGTEGEASETISRAEAVREDYRSRFEAHVEGLRELALRLGFGFRQHRTDQSAESTLLHLYMALSAPRDGEGRDRVATC